MSKIIALDIGGKRTGVAETDPMQIIASPLETVDTERLLPFLTEYLKREDVETIVLGDPKSLSGGESDNSALVQNVAKKLNNIFPGIRIAFQDERFTSRMAVQSMIAAGVKKSDRRNKKEVDKISATLILQSFLQSR